MIVGSFTGTLIVSPNREHQNQMIQLFGRAHYALLSDNLTGHKYRVILVFKPDYTFTYFEEAVRGLNTRLWGHNARLVVL